MGQKEIAERYEKTFCARVRSRRIEIGMSQIELAKVIDRQPPAVNKIEMGINTTTLGQACLIANALDTTVDWLLGNERVENLYSKPLIVRKIVKGVEDLTEDERRDVYDFVRYIQFKKEMKKANEGEKE